MKFYLTLIMMLLLSSVFAGNEAEHKHSAVPWHQPDAMYRIEAVRKASEEQAILDDRRLCLPAEFSNGVQVFDAAGASIPAHLYADGGLLLPPSADDTILYFYFGFTEKQEKLPMAANPLSNVRLMLYQTAPQMALVPEEWRSILDIHGLGKTLGGRSRTLRK